MGRVVIGMDPHKRSATIEIIDEREQVPAQGRYGTDTDGYQQMLAAGRRHPDRVWAVEGETPRGMDTDKAWAAIEYLLAPLNPPVEVISGGDPLTEEVWGYDAPRLLSVEEVVTAARFLDATPFALLAEHYHPNALTDSHIYPQIWDEDDALDYLGGFYSDIFTLLPPTVRAC